MLCFKYPQGFCCSQSCYPISWSSVNIWLGRWRVKWTAAALVILKWTCSAYPYFLSFVYPAHIKSEIIRLLFFISLICLRWYVVYILSLHGAANQKKVDLKFKYLLLYCQYLQVPEGLTRRTNLTLKYCPLSPFFDFHFYGTCSLIPAAIVFTTTYHHQHYFRTETIQPLKRSRLV